MAHRVDAELARRDFLRLMAGGVLTQFSEAGNTIRDDFLLPSPNGGRLMETPLPYIAEGSIKGSGSRISKVLLLFDTGSTYSILDRKLRASHHIKDEGDVKVQGVDGKYMTYLGGLWMSLQLVLQVLRMFKLSSTRIEHALE